MVPIRNVEERAFSEQFFFFFPFSPLGGGTGLGKKKKKNDEYGPVHGGDAPRFLGGPMGSQYHLRMRL